MMAKIEKCKEAMMNKTLKLTTQFEEIETVQLRIGNYRNNNGLFIGLIDVSDEYPVPYGNVTVNLEKEVPDYCAFVDINNMPELEKFIQDNDLGAFTGLVEQSGFCEYPLYSFNAEKLRELCPDGMLEYEQSIAHAQEPIVKRKSR